MSAVFAALFGTPVTAALFSVEVISIGILYYSALVPCILSATISYAITEKFHITPTYFILNQVPEMSLATGMQVRCDYSWVAAPYSASFLLYVSAGHRKNIFKKISEKPVSSLYWSAVCCTGSPDACRAAAIVLSGGSAMNIIEQQIHGTAKPGSCFILFRSSLFSLRHENTSLRFTVAETSEPSLVSSVQSLGSVPGGWIGARFQIGSCYGGLYVAQHCDDAFLQNAFLCLIIHLCVPTFFVHVMDDFWHLF